MITALDHIAIAVPDLEKSTCGVDLPPMMNAADRLSSHAAGMSRREAFMV